MIQLYEYSFFRLFSIIDCYKILNIVPCDIPINSCHCIPVNPMVFYTSPTPFPFGNLQFVFHLCEFVSLVYRDSFYFSDSTYKWYIIFVFLWFIVLSMIFSRSIHISASDNILFFLWLDNIPLCIHTTSFFYLILYWSIIALQCCVDFCIQQHESAISVCVCVCVCVCISSPFWISLPLPPHPTPPGHHRALSWACCDLQQVPTSYLLATW